MRQNDSQLSVGSKNGSLVTSNEELWSRNEELSGLNIQLRKALERQRAISSHLQNLLNNADVATVFLDSDLNIRFFTPAAISLFGIISTDIGRPLTDIESLAADVTLLADARAVLQKQISLERVVEAQNGLWFIRQISLYRTDDQVGMVITSVNITEQKQAAKASELAGRRAEFAKAAKSRFLAAASHDLRQPLQTLYLLHGLLATCVKGEKASNLVKRIDQTLSRMSGMLSTLLAPDRIEAGFVRADMMEFPINDLLNQMKVEAALETVEARTIRGDLIPADYSQSIDVTARHFAAAMKDKLLRHRGYVRVVNLDIGANKSDICAIKMVTNRSAPAELEPATAGCCRNSYGKR